MLVSRQALRSSESSVQVSPESVIGLGIGLCMQALRPTNVLMVFPQFVAGAFWNFQAACELFGAKYPL